MFNICFFSKEDQGGRSSDEPSLLLTLPFAFLVCVMTVLSAKLNLKKFCRGAMSSRWSREEKALDPTLSLVRRFAAFQGASIWLFSFGFFFKYRSSTVFCSSSTVAVKPVWCDSGYRPTLGVYLFQGLIKSFVAGRLGLTLRLLRGVRGYTHVDVEKAF